MNNRTKFLLAVMVIVGIFAIGDRAYRRFVERPFEKRQRELGRLDKQISRAEEIIFKSAGVADQLSALERYSLPYDEELARARYQDWLLALIEKVDLRQPGVDAGNPIRVTIEDRDTNDPKEIYKRYSFSLRGRGTLAQITRLLYDFYHGGHLHKIRTLTLNPTNSGKLLDVNMGIEALGLARCERESELSTATAKRLAYAEFADYQNIVRRNFFSREGADALHKTMLTAVTFNRGGTPGAWFSLGSDVRTQVVHRGESLSVASHHVEVVDIQPELVLVDVDGEVVSMSLGDTIHETLTAPSLAGEASSAIVR